MCSGEKNGRRGGNDQHGGIENLYSTDQFERRKSMFGEKNGRTKLCQKKNDHREKMYQVSTFSF